MEKCSENRIIWWENMEIRAVKTKSCKRQRLADIGGINVGRGNKLSGDDDTLLQKTGADFPRKARKIK